MEKFPENKEEKQAIEASPERRRMSAGKLGKEAIKAVSAINGIDDFTYTPNNNYEDDNIKVEITPGKEEGYGERPYYPDVQIYTKENGEPELVYEAGTQKGLIDRLKVKRHNSGSWEKDLQEVIAKGKKAQEEAKKKQLEDERERFADRDNK